MPRISATIRRNEETRSAVTPIFFIRTTNNAYKQKNATIQPISNSGCSGYFNVFSENPAPMSIPSGNACMNTGRMYAALVLEMIEIKINAVSG
jgi:hypothetical protein